MKYHTLHASLEDAIQRWIGTECDGSSWITELFPDNGAEIMATAAMAVLQAIEDSAKFTEENHED